MCASGNLSFPSEKKPPQHAHVHLKGLASQDKASHQKLWLLGSGSLPVHHRLTKIRCGLKGREVLSTSMMFTTGLVSKMVTGGLALFSVLGMPTATATNDGPIELWFCKEMVSFPGPSFDQCALFFFLQEKKRNIRVCWPLAGCLFRRIPSFN